MFGGECKLCDCNGHSATCDPLTLKCDVRVEEVVIPVDVPVVVPVVASVVRVTFDNFVVVVVLMLVVVVISMLLKLDFVPIEKSS